MITSQLSLGSPDPLQSRGKSNRSRRGSWFITLLFILLIGPVPFLCSAVIAQENIHPEHGIYDADLLPAAFYKSNRERLMKSIGDTAVAVLYAAGEHTRNGDAQYRYRQNDDLLYLSGCNEPNSILILAPAGITLDDSGGARRVRELLFLMPRDPSRETWTGKRLGVEGARRVLGFEAALANTELEKYLYRLLRTAKVAYVPLRPDGIEGDIKTYFDKISEAEFSLGARVEFRDPSALLSRMRQVKSPEELTLMRKAARISAGAHAEAIKSCRHGLYEYHLQSLFENACTMMGAEDMAFPCICGSGENSTILHYEANRKQLRDGELVLMDCGCEYHNYASDITRTIPVNGHFSKPQLEIYSIVLAAHDSAIAAIRPNISYNDSVTPKAVKVIQDGLLQLGIIKDRDDYRRFFNHGLGHPVGLDVHDVMTDDLLEPGEVWTVEPGIYIPANTPGVDAKYWNIGIRIEDDVLITECGSEVISSSVPVEPAAIEKLMER